MYAKVSHVPLREDANYLAYFRSFCNTGLTLVKITNPTDQNIRYILLFHQRELKLSSVSFFSAIGTCKTCFSVAQSLPLCSVCTKQNTKNPEEANNHIKLFSYSYNKEEICQKPFAFSLEPAFLCRHFLKQHKKIKSPHFISLLNWNGGRITQQKRKVPFPKWSFTTSSMAT